jgi:mutator protein MutT
MSRPAEPPQPDPPRPDARAIPAGIGLIRRGDAFLIRQRPAGTVYAGYWEFPGGKCEPGETPAQATARECLEETGLRIVVGPLRRTVTYPYPHGLVELSFHDCRTEDPEAEPDPDTGFRWISINHLAALRFPEANEVILDELAQEWRSRHPVSPSHPESPDLDSDGPSAADLPK